MAKQVIGFEATFDGSKVEKSVKSIKTELREAQNEAINLARKFGDTSDEALNAAKRVANLRDEVGDFKQRIDALNPDAKFRALGQSLQGVAGGFAGLQGAVGLFGTESKDLEKQLLKVQSALALSQGLDAILESKDAFKNLKVVAVDAFKGIKAAIGSTGIGLLVVALGTIVAYWDEIKTAVGGVSDAQRKLNEQSSARFKTEQDNLKTINDQDNTLKLQGLSEKEILELKKKQTEEAIVAGETSIKIQATNIDLAIEAEKRNKKLLEGYLQFVLIIPRTLFKYSSQAINGIVELLNKVPGVNIDFKINEKLLDEGIGGLTKMIFDPEQTKNNGKATLKEANNVLIQLRNQRDGYILESQKPKGGGGGTQVGSVDAVEAERTAELERMQGLQAISVGVTQQTNDLITKSNYTAAQMNADVQKWNTNMEDEQSKARQKINEQEFVAKQENARKYSDLIGGFADLAGRQTGVGKTLAIAEATINTYLAASQVLSAKSPQYIVNPFLRFSSAALTIAMGLKNVKSILSVKVPNGGGAGGSLPSGSGGGATAPTQAPIASAVQVSQTQTLGTSSVNVANQTAVKAFVVERDITDSQDRISKIKSAATF